MTNYDALVVGAGPAGATAAARLAAGGARVALLEKAALPRYKTCGGGILRRTYKILPPAIHPAVERTFTSIALNFHDPARHFTATRDTPIVYMTMRDDLDHRLARHAQAAGAHLFENCTVLEITRRKNHVELSTTHGPLCARAVIAADGATSRIAKSAGWPEPPPLIPALEYEITVNDADFARLGHTARFDFALATTAPPPLPALHGYAWVFPKRNHLSVGILTTRRGHIDLHAHLERYLDLLDIRNPVAIKKHGYTIPIAPRNGPLARAGIFLVGDAAGLADPVTLEGISHAVISGERAAEALLTQPSTRAAEMFYQHQLDTGILAELKAARPLAALLYRWPRLRNLAFRQSGQRLCEYVTDIVTGEKTYRAALTNPTSYITALGIRPVALASRQ